MRRLRKGKLLQIALHLVDDRFDEARQGGAHGRAEVIGEAGGIDFNAPQHQPGWRLTQTFSQGERLGQPESVAGCEITPGGKNGLLLQTVQGPGPGAASYRVDQHHSPGALQQGNECSTGAVVNGNGNLVGMEHIRQRLDRQQPHPVVTPGRTDAEEADRSGHVRSTRKSRKWVAQEMHGS